MSPLPAFKARRRAAIAAVAVGAAIGFTGCGSLLPASAPPPARYALRGEPVAALATVAADSAVARAAMPTLVVNPPHAAAGFNSAHIVYVRHENQFEHFAHSEWVDTPVQMLAPLIVAALTQGGAFRSVAQAPSAASGELRLDTLILRLQHESGEPPSRVRFAIRVQIIDDHTHRMLASRDLEATAAAARDDPAGGVAAAQKAVQAVLDQLVLFCADAAAMLATSGPPGSLSSSR
jgi:cholesterol transport system auxiliary component